LSKNTLHILLPQAFDALRRWAEVNPDEYDPADAIDNIIRAITQNADPTDPTIAEKLSDALWDEWLVIEGEREMISEMEDDLD
jgi:hypothetical protein